MISPLSLYKCLADDTRLKSILLILLKNELCVCDLQRCLALSQPKVSRHLAELRKCGLLADERRGKWVFYRLPSELPGWVYELLNITAENNREYLQQSLALLDACSTSSCD